MSQVVVRSSAEKNLRNEIKAGSHTFVADAPKDVGGEASAPDPHELLLAALGACTSMTLKIFAGKRDWDLKTVDVTLEEQSIEDPAAPGKKLTRINRDIKVTGNLTQEQLDTLKTIADKCPIHKLLVGQKEVATALHGS